MTKLMLLLLTIVSRLGSIYAFSPTLVSHHARNRQSPQVFSRTLPVVESAKVLPIAYSGASAALLYRATKAASKTDKGVLLATAALSLFNLGPTDNARLTSAKRSLNIYQACNPPSEHRKRALKYRSLVRMKLIGQLIGLVWMIVAKTSTNIMIGAAIVMATNMLFFLLGAGGANHNKEGIADPMPTSKSRGLLAIDTILTAAALVAASSPVDSTRYATSAGVFVVGSAIGGLEGLGVLIAGFVGDKK